MNFKGEKLNLEVFEGSTEIAQKERKTPTVGERKRERELVRTRDASLISHCQLISGAE